MNFLSSGFPPPGRGGPFRVGDRYEGAFAINGERPLGTAGAASDRKIDRIAHLGTCVGRIHSVDVTSSGFATPDLNAFAAQVPFFARILGNQHENENGTKRVQCQYILRVCGAHGGFLRLFATSFCGRSGPGAVMMWRLFADAGPTHPNAPERQTKGQRTQVASAPDAAGDELGGVRAVRPGMNNLDPPRCGGVEVIQTASSSIGHVPSAPFVRTGKLLVFYKYFQLSPLLALCK